MKGRDGYAVFFFPQALEALGEAIKPYIQDSPVVGPHVSCDEIDTAGGLIEMTLNGRMPTGEDVALEMMVPASMVRMIVSRQSDGRFGFGPRSYEDAAAALPVIAAPAPAAATPSQAVPDAGADAAQAPQPAGEGDAAAKPAP